MKKEKEKEKNNLPTGFYKCICIHIYTVSTWGSGKRIICMYVYKYKT